MLRTTILGAAAGFGLMLASVGASAATFTAWGNPGNTATTVTVTGAELITPPYVDGGFCGSTRATSCNVAHDVSGAIGAYNGYASTDPRWKNPEGGSKPEAERWYLAQLTNNSSLVSAAFTKTDVPTESSSATISAAQLAGYAYLVLKYNGEWAFLRLTGGPVSISGLPNALSHWTAVTPIPAALPLLLTALGGLLGFRWFRRRKEENVRDLGMGAAV